MTNDPRYSPPSSVVADPAPPSVPSRVRLAVKFLWASMALAVPAVYLDMDRNPEAGYVVFAVLVYALLFAFNAFVNVMVHRGRNWARLITFAFVLIGAFFMFIPVEEPAPPSILEWAINVVCLVLECVAIYLLFTQPGAAWFKSRE